MKNQPLTGWFDATNIGRVLKTDNVFTTKREAFLL